MVEVRADGAEEVLRATYGIPSDDWRPFVDLARAAPDHPQESESQRALFARRFEEHRTRRVRSQPPCGRRRRDGGGNASR